MTQSPKSPQDRAKMQALKEQEGAKAMSDYEAAAQAVREKTARLRALRLAREAAAGPKPVKTPAAKKKQASKKTEKTGTLADWIAAEQRAGRRV